LVSYHLETVQSNPNEKITDTQFTEVYSGLEKQYRLTKLNPGSTYKFRLAAANDLGKRFVSYLSLSELSASISLRIHFSVSTVMF